jgi:hypothetical protein
MWISVICGEHGPFAIVSTDGTSSRLIRLSLAGIPGIRLIALGFVVGKAIKAN